MPSNFHEYRSKQIFQKRTLNLAVGRSIDVVSYQKCIANFLSMIESLFRLLWCWNVEISSVVRYSTGHHQKTIINLKSVCVNRHWAALTQFGSTWICVKKNIIQIKSMWMLEYINGAFDWVAAAATMAKAVARDTFIKMPMIIQCINDSKCTLKPKSIMHFALAYWVVNWFRKYSQKTLWTRSGCVCMCVFYFLVQMLHLQWPKINPECR